ncbi:IS5 family transposase [Halosimplex pelagicum]|uniref:IS5 family transposase n=1 Tax=Halosimplex pelagicum TaxID=869886 RepID=A0A7D5PH41_9EURY|nr:IS5 family transposase [Halosimplex pelagicum]QLH81684.1 IS5 family transposase [Halosimplex pelagicum]QLH82997.1 IS5 family transposase [Halosimplex pelagicum]QLH83028.1 IS5 family transposase [Halosimplex pelagicum]QLH84352.1 IS5 family transposase [Halosimplex pelagicum]QLH84799.1 IS5 family transposase [Halosimplex pelagicum]
MSKISRFTNKAVQLAKNAVGGRGEVAAPEGGGGFAEYAVLSLHCLRVYLEKSYRETLDLLSEMPQILGEIGLDATDLPDHSTLVKWFDRIKTALWRVLLRLSAQLHDPSGHAAIDATFFDRETASKHYCRRTNYRVQTLKTTALVDTESHAILDVHCTTEKRHDTQLGWQVARRNAGDLASLAADKGYDWMELREKLREEGVRPLIKHREFRPIDHAHNARIDGPRYRQRSTCETVFSTIKRTLGDAVRARAWFREFREIVLKCVVHNIKRAVTP